MSAWQRSRITVFDCTIPGTQTVSSSLLITTHGFYHCVYPSLSESGKTLYEQGENSSNDCFCRWRNKAGAQRAGKPRKNFDANIDRTTVQITRLLFHPPVCALLCTWSAPEKKQKKTKQKHTKPQTNKNKQKNKQKQANNKK